MYLLLFHQNPSENGNDGNVMYSEMNNAAPGSSVQLEENSTPTVSDEPIQQPQSDDRVEIDPKPSVSNQTVSWSYTFIKIIFLAVRLL